VAFENRQVNPMTSLDPVWDQIRAVGSAVEKIIARLEKLEGKMPATAKVTPRLASKAPQKSTKQPTMFSEIDTIANRFDDGILHTASLLRMAAAESNAERIEILELDVAGEIDSEMAIRLVGQIMNNPTAENVTVRIDSNGGHVASAEMIASALLAHPCADKTAVISGACSSAAIMLALCCENRFAHKGVLMNLHRTKALYGRSQKDKASTISCLASDEIEMRLAKRAGVDVDSYRQRRAEDAFLNFDECTSIGILNGETGGFRFGPVAFADALPAAANPDDYFSFETINGQIYFMPFPKNVVSNLARLMRNGTYLSAMDFPLAIVEAARKLADGERNDER
jgi:ATP-dependent protease ClpP protease subunit